MARKYEPPEPEILLTPPKNFKQLTLDDAPLITTNPKAHQFADDEGGTVFQDSSGTAERMRGVPS